MRKVVAIALLFKPSRNCIFILFDHMGRPWLSCFSRTALFCRLHRRNSSAMAQLLALWPLLICDLETQRDQWRKKRRKGWSIALWYAELLLICVFSLRRPWPDYASSWWHIPVKCQVPGIHRSRTIAEQSGPRTSEMMPLLFQHRSLVRLAISHFASIWAGLGVGGSGAVVAQEDAPLPERISDGAWRAAFWRITLLLRRRDNRD